MSELDLNKKVWCVLTRRDLLESNHSQEVPVEVVRDYVEGHPDCAVVIWGQQDGEEAAVAVWVGASNVPDNVYYAVLNEEGALDDPGDAEGGDLDINEALVAVAEQFNIDILK